MMYRGWAAFFLLAVIWASVPAVHAQQSIGIQWEVPISEQRAHNQLDTFHELGVNHVLVDTFLTEGTWSKIDSLDFNVHAEVPLPFPTVHTFSQADSSMLETYNNYLAHYINQPSVHSIGLFRFGQTAHPDFSETLTPFIEELTSTYSGELFFTSSTSKRFSVDQLVDFKILSINERQINENTSIHSQNIGGYLYAPEQSDTLLSPVKELISSAQEHSIPVFFKSRWLLDTTDRYPELQRALQHYSSTGEVVFPVPEEPSPTAEKMHAFPVILLLIIWGIFAFSYHTIPLYHKATSRYFTAHRFLIDDIMKRHLRSLSPGLLILLQHIIAGGLISYMMGFAFFSDLGLKALAHHLPALTFFGNPLTSLFIWGSLVSLIFHVITIAWIGLLNKQIQHFSQILLVYCWPLQINLLVATVMVALHTSVESLWPFYLLGSLFLAILLLSFFIAATDTARYTKAKKGLFLLGTVGVYSLIVSSFFIWFINQTEWLDVVRLSQFLA